MNKMRSSILVKLIGLVCTLALVLGAVYVPVTLSAFAATIPVTPDETITFGFETAEDPAINNGSYKDRAEDGFGVASWGISVKDLGGNKVIGQSWGDTITYVQKGGYRLNNKDGVYRLDTNSRYIVRFKLSLTKAPTQKAVADFKSNAYIKMGYGFTGPHAGGNQVNTMDVVIANVAESRGDFYTVADDISGTKEVTPSNKWYDLTYVFTTPNDFAGKNNSFGFFAMNIPGTEFYIDDVQITKLGDTTGVVLANDPYSGESTLMKGTIGQNVELPVLVGREEDHEFLGWYTDENKTVSANGMKYTAEIQNAYAKWRAPVTLTFKDKYNETEVVLGGLTGDAIAFPADPVDTKNNPANFLFEGWYTTEMFTEKYEEETFGATDLTLYAKWMEKEQVFVQDFEDYSYSDKTATAPYIIDGATQVKYTNSEHFATPMTKIDDPTNSGKGKVVKFEWDPDMTYVDGNPDTYNAAKEYTYRRNGSITMGDHTFVDGLQYIMYFDYYVEDIGSQTVKMEAYNIHYNKGWNVNLTTLATKAHTITADDKDGKWHTGTVIFTMKETTTAGAYVHAMFRNVSNGKAKIYLDNFRFVPVQVNEVIMTVNKNNGEGVEYVPVVKGEEVNLENPAFGDRIFKGWYKEEGLSNLFDGVALSNNFSVYARWNDIPMDFQNYPFSTTSVPIFGKTESIVKGEGVGHGDDAVLKFMLDGDAVYSTADDGTVTYWASRAGRDIGGHVAKIGTVEEGAVYKVSFWYKGDPTANANTLIRLQVASPNDCWTNSKTDTTAITVQPGQTQWQKVEFLYYATLKDPSANGLFIRFASLGKVNDLDQLAIAYVDDVLVEKVDKPYIVFDSQNGKLPTVVQGKAGETIPVISGAKKLGYDFDGWYLDKEFTEPFTATKFAADMGVTVYAKYVLASSFSESFEAYSYNTANIAIFGKTVSIIKGEGVGHEDDAAAKFVLDGDAIYSQDASGTTYWASRAGRDIGGHVVKLGPVEEGEVYKVSFWYKGDANANVDSLIRFQTANPEDCWTYGKTDTNSVTIKPGTGWTKKEFLFYATLKDPKGYGLFVRFNSLGKAGDLEQLAIAYIDDIVVEKIAKPFVIFDGQNNKQSEIVQGKAGEEIKFPATPKKVGMKFVGWYLDKDCTEPFTDTIFADGMGITVYAKYDYADSFTVNFENVGKNRGEEDDFLFYRGGMGAVSKVGYNKSTALFFDRTTTSDWSSTNALFEDGNQVIISNKNKYYVTFKYCVTEQQTSGGFLYLRAASPGNGWGAKYSKDKTFENAGVISIDYPVSASAEVGKWYTAAVILDTSKIYVHKVEDGGDGDPTAYAAMYMYYRGGGGKVAVDDITFKKLPAGHQAYIVDNGGANSVPSYVTGRIGTSFRSQLPKNPQYENHIFKNYFRYDKNHNQAVLEDADMVFTEDNLNLVTNWVRLHTVQDFEDYENFYNTYPGYGPADFDYELYDAKAEGNSADNVTSGRYSIHRKGESAYFENIQILSENLRICADEKFTITMKVKVGKHFHTDGAIKIVACKSPTHAWTNTGSFHPVGVIADIADGEWHEISYTFSAVERYLAIQTPGYVEIFIDDVVIDRADPEMPVSTPPEYTEYVPALRDADGNLLKIDTTSIDVSSIIDFSLYIGGFNALPVIIIGGVILIAGAAFVVLFVIKKRKANKQ